MSVLAIPSAMDLLKSQLRTAADADDLALPLRALQFRGLSKTDLVVHLERLRAANEVLDRDEQFEENCLLALDIVNGSAPGLGLRWDASHVAAVLLPRCVTEADLASAFAYAVQPSDLLPPRGDRALEHGALAPLLSRATFDSVAEYQLLPSRADFFRVPKSAFTTRPAALLTIPDRLILECLTARVETELDQALPAAVVWPRVRSQVAAHRDATERVVAWASDYVVKADISAFYATVPHALLAVFLSTHVSVPVPHARAIEAMLTSVMGLTSGLPQGPASSDVLASAYLLPIDSQLELEGLRFVRYADDYFFPAATMGEGRRIIQRLEDLLGDVGLTLNEPKTQIMRVETFERGLRRPSPAVTDLKERLTQLEIEGLHQIDDQDELAGLLAEAGVEEETLWELLYHGTTTLEEVMPELRTQLGPTLSNTYSLYLQGIAATLAGAEREGNFGPLEILSRECLAFLAATEVDVRPDDLRRVQTWFPGTTPAIAQYLIARDASAAWVREYLRQQIAEPSGVDWVDAWMAHAAGRAPAAVSLPLVEELRLVVEDAQAGPLSRAEAIKSLAVLGSLTEGTWRGVFATASPALRSEMFFAAIGELPRYPWLRPYLRTTEDPALTMVAAELEASFVAAVRADE